MSENQEKPGNMTDVQHFLQHLDGGVFEEKFATKLSEVALGVMVHEKKGKVVLTFDLTNIGSSMVGIDHTITYQVPTKNGHIGETNKTGTPMHVGNRGKMTFFPDNQMGLQFDTRVSPADA